MNRKEEFIAEDAQVLKKYDSLYFYLKKIAFGHINTFKAGRQLGGENGPMVQDDISKDEKLKRRKKLADIAKIGTIALGPLGSDSLLSVPKLNVGRAKADLQVDASARQSARMANAPQGP